MSNGQDFAAMNDESHKSTKIRIGWSHDRDAAPRNQLPEDTETGENVWTTRLVLFLRIMAVIAMGMGLYNWAQITGFIGGEENAFEVHTMQWRSATVYFAVIELVAAVGLWLATPWGAVVWLTTVVSMAVVELMFPTIYGGHLTIVVIALILLATYLALAWMAARERPP